MKHAEKVSGDFWGQSIILKVVPRSYPPLGEGLGHYNFDDILVYGTSE